eukprot:gnl/MRDRNA2_/MRDRNA2_225440_c0_seq1.p1 gnl/MRDRNA2_/MRDRNA2_225440_c0~~gnl/MRDRNA2_/MRDRNA2_225440_c0_seq1.p1  ORF type:complete len:481 (-),score=96.43 gnl/MRDRNA2_/MRDRNA2_225440_c0_seq1:44-1456(-)
MVAAEDGNVPMLRELLFNPASTDRVNLLSQDRMGMTVLHLACFKGHMEAVQSILDWVYKQRPPLFSLFSVENYRSFNVADVALSGKHVTISAVLASRGAMCNKVQKLAIFEAIEKGSPAAVSGIIDSKANLAETNPQGLAPVHAAAMQSKPEIIMLMCTSGAQINEPTLFTGDTALHIATRLKRTELVSQFVAWRPQIEPGKKPPPKVDINLKNNDQETPLDIAFDADDETLAKVLLKHGAKLGLHRDTCLESCLKTGRLQWIDLCIRGGANIISQNSEDRGTALHTAACIGENVACTQILQAKASLSAKNKHGAYPLHLALNSVTVQVLLDAKAEINVKDFQLQTPLHHACAKNNSEVVGALLQKKAGQRAKSDVPDINRDTAAHVAARAGSTEALKTLVQLATIFPLTRNQDGETALDVARNTGHQDAANVIAVAGRKPTGTQPNPQEKPSDNARETSTSGKVARCGA